MKRCAICGAEIPDNEWLCNACKEGPAARSSGGQPQAPGTPVQPTAVAVKTAAPVQTQTQAAVQAPKKEAPRKKVPKPGALRRSRNILIEFLVITV